MSKKKVMSISVLSVLLVYFICILVSFISACFSVDQDFKSHIEKLENMNALYENKYPDTLLDLNDKDSIIKQRFLDQMQFPYCVGFYNAKGNLEAYTTSSLELRVQDIEIKEIKVYRSDLEDVIDKDNLNYIFETCKEMGVNGAGVERMNYNLEGGRVIPSYIQVSVNGVLIDINISNEKTQYRLNNHETTEDSNHFSKNAAIYIYLNPCKSYKDKMDYELSLKLKQDIKNEGIQGQNSPQVMNPLDSKEQGKVALSLPASKVLGKGRFGFSIYMNETIHSADGSYTMVIATERTPFASIILSDYFMKLFKVTNYIGAVLMVVVLVLTSIIYDKNKRLEDSRKAFINAAAHELKTPLAVISNNCECIMENVSPEKNESYVNTIYNESKRMTKLTQMLINYNKVMQRGSIEKTKIDLSSIVQKECEKYKSVFESKNMNVQLNTVPAIIKCNEDLIALAVDNFLSNAAKYGKENTDVVVNVVKNKNSVRFSIYNESDPIPDEALPHIWEELYRVDKSRNSKDNSTGMGLAINRQIFEIHKFKYDCKNIKNGVEFSFKA